MLQGSCIIKIWYISTQMKLETQSQINILDGCELFKEEKGAHFLTLLGKEMLAFILFCGSLVYQSILVKLPFKFHGSRNCIK